jgi:hypothetical protein
MARAIKPVSKKFSFPGGIHKMRHGGGIYLRDKAAEKRNIIQRLVHPDYILFDWEFFSNQLEFE